MNILVVNDDGVDAIGIHKLAFALRKYGNVVVCAPDTGRSAASHSIVIQGPLTFKYLGEYDHIEWYKTSGMPADCVRMAMKLTGLDFDLVFSGVNDGLNLGTDIIYSGTVSAAREAHIQGIPAIAISTDYGAFSIVDAELDALLNYIFEKELYSREYVLNINFPEEKFLNSLGYRFCRQGIKIFNTGFKQLEKESYLNDESIITYDENQDTDVYLAGQGYITLVPLQVEQTKLDSLEQLKKKQ